jgi:NADH-quinone oxidoreductase subunit M
MEFSGFPYLTAILLSCVTGLLVILFVPDANRSAVRWVSAVFSGITLALSVAVFLLYDTARGGLQFVERAAWVPSMGIQYLNAVDGFSLPMVLLTGIVFFTGVLTMWELEHRVKEFYAFYFLLVTGVFGLFMSLDLFFIIIWYDV